MTKKSGITPISKRDIPGAPLRSKRKSRIKDIEDFINSGDEAWKIELEHDELVGSVRSSYRHALLSQPAFASRCIVVRRGNTLYLVRKEV